MEKRKPHYPLADIQKQMDTVEALNMTQSAKTGMRLAGMVMVFLSCGFVEYFCAAKSQNCDLKTVQGAKRLMLERLVMGFALSLAFSHFVPNHVSWLNALVKR